MLSLAAGVLPEFDPLTIIGAAASAGFEGVGIWFDPETWTDKTSAEVRARLDDTGLHPLDMEPVFLTPNGDHGDRLIDAAMEVGASNILTVSLGLELEPFAARFGQLCDRAAPAGMTVNVEFGRIFGIKTLPDAERVLSIVDRPNAGILLDNIHVDRAGHTNDEVGAIDPAVIRYAQVCDGPASAADPSPAGLRTDALDDRCNLGEGGLPWREFLQALPDDTPISLEIRSAALRAAYADPAERALAVRAQTKVALAEPVA